MDDKAIVTDDNVSFVRFVRSFVRSFVRAFVRSFVRALSVVVIVCLVRESLNRREQQVIGCTHNTVQ